ncbi:MAG: hypothetical protein JWQ29_2043 [Phenylobacterium sp.]|nr:hypothetical protein [Phenylobacterium sp.]
MTRTLIQPQVSPAPPGARGRSGRRASVIPPSARTAINPSPAAAVRPADRPIRPGYGLLIAAGAAAGLWVGLAKLALIVLR